MALDKSHVVINCTTGHVGRRAKYKGTRKPSAAEARAMEPQPSREERIAEVLSNAPELSAETRAALKEILPKT